MAKFGIRFLGDIGFEDLPIPVLVSDFLAETTDRQQTLQDFYLAHQFAVLEGNNMGQVRKQGENQNLDRRIESGLSQAPGDNPEKIEAKSNKRHGTSENNSRKEAESPRCEKNGKKI